MTLDSAVDDRLAEAIALREGGEDQAALAALLELHAEEPQHPVVNLQCAWIHDKLGLESEAVPFYEQALEGGLEGDDLRAALLGLGSTYRALGRYPESLRTLERGSAEFPHEHAMSVFRAMALYNNGLTKEGCQLLLTVLIETTSDDSIVSYRGAIEEYARDLDRTWS
ncbi:MAG: tetratricopeptide repeat protein [Acidimicrobiia bacterium]